MRFTKMHGLGNDYLYVEAAALPDDAPALAVRWSDRHTGVGSDGIIWILPPATPGADAFMRIFNADGSEAKMCGNGIRCVAAFLAERRPELRGKQCFMIDTLSGLKTVEVERDAAGRVTGATVDMGVAHVADVPVQVGPEGLLDALPVDVGNPHAVIFCEDAEAAPVGELGPAIEHDAAFPSGVNVEFVSVTSPQRLRMRVWERGSGITMACGTGACASVAAAVANGLAKAGEPVIVRLDGGELFVTVEADGQVRMRGPAAFVCDGETID